jgi:hypothetical protein
LLIAVDFACQQEKQSSITIVASSCPHLPMYVAASIVVTLRNHFSYGNDPLQTLLIAPKSGSLAV